MRKSPFAGATAGFTLIELIAVLLLTGILAIAVLPRMADRSAFDSRGFTDTTRATLQHARRVAIAQRRTVCVTFPSSSSLTLGIASAAETLDCSTPGTMNGPKATPASATLTAKAGSGVAYSATPTALNFNGLGQPTTSAGVALTSARTIQVVGVGNAITVEAATGYVHE